MRRRDRRIHRNARPVDGHGRNPLRLDPVRRLRRDKFVRREHDLGGLSGGGLTPSLAGVHTGAITGNGGKRNGSTTSSHTASTLTTSRTADVANTTKVAGGAVHTGGGGHFFHAGKRP